MIQFYGMQLTYQYAKQGEQGGNFGLEVSLEDATNAPQLFKYNKFNGEDF